MHLDLNYIPRYINSSIKQFSQDERHVSRYNRQNILILVLEGRLCFEEDGEAICLAAGEYYIQAMGHWQTGNLPSMQPRYCFINFSGQFTDCADRALAVRGSFDIPSLEPICQRLCAMQRSLAKSTDIGMMFEVQRLFFDVLNGLYRGNIDLAQKRSLAERIYDHITEHFAEEISLLSLAERFNYSQDHITRVFKSMYRITPYQYLLQCRVCYSKLLLSSEGMRVSEVAIACGFSDASTFYRAFMKLEGISPAKYRISKK